jgi:succinyl-CoA synthetase alpha subunit
MVVILIGELSPEEPTDVAKVCEKVRVLPSPVVT